MMDINDDNAASFTAAAIIPHMTTANVDQQLEVMRLQEDSTYRCNDFFGEADRNIDIDETPRHSAVTRDCRTKMCHWSFQIVDYCQFRRETVDIAMSYLDRFISTNCAEALEALQDKRQYQLAAMTGLYMAIKLHEPMEMHTSLLSEVSRGEYSADDIAQMEGTMLNALKWRLNGPTRLTFALHFLALLPAKIREDKPVAETILKLIGCQTELATTDYYFTTRKQSIAGLASVLNTLAAMGLGRNETRAFCNDVIRFGGMNPFSAEVQEARWRLVQATGGMDEWSDMAQDLMSQSSSGLSSSFTKVAEVSLGRCVEKDSDNDKESSPVCVSRRAIEQ